MPIRQINVTFNVTDRQYELLVMGRCDKPNPERLKRLLLNEAARNVRTTIDMGLRDEHAHREAKPAKGFAETVIDEGRSRARKYEHLPVKTERAIDDYERRQKKLLLADSKRKARDRAKVGKLLTNSKADRAVPFTPTPLEDLEF